jgi:hypothetical protein
MDNAIQGNLIYDYKDIEDYLVDIFSDISLEPDVKNDDGSEYYKVNGRLGIYYGNSFDVYISPIFLR